jgi:hypothetical protein
MIYLDDPKTWYGLPLLDMMNWSLSMTIRYGISGIIQIMDNTIIYQSLSISACRDYCHQNQTTLVTSEIGVLAIIPSIA